MTVPAQRVRRRPSGRVLPLLLVVAMLAPVAFLFAQHDRLTGDDRDLAVRERLGVEYLRALGPVTEALVDAQSAAVAGRPAGRDALDRAVRDAAGVDVRIGDELRSHERWAGLRAKLEALPERPLTDPEAAFVAYGEVTDLLLALHRKVRESSGLVRDPRQDSFFLQDSIGLDLPTAMVAAGRLADLSALGATRPAAERARTQGELAELRVGALASATDLVADLREAVDSSESTDLGTNVLTPLDTYQRAVEALAAFSGPSAGSKTGLADPGQVAAARLNAQSAARQLQPVILDQLDALLKERIESYDRDRRLAAGAAGTAVLLVLLLAGVLIAAYRRARRYTAEARRAGDGDTDTVPEPQRWAPPAAERSIRPEDHRLLQPAGSGRDGGSERWGPFDAAR
ncbi:cbb3-type cytochrome oxidase subunit 3 [Micromonospora sp. A200]|uniref:hypothetical protein n=1 Tax=Micromonospora sp. A200 TaxID=2940568 RepID=UPI002475D076|nr:hypothetical protein [Micromonospora sp. A200]MDH6464543.1 cbb3-type cytochrome oxidase subunit 3 [Micromonospora sp. A200]